MNAAGVDVSKGKSMVAVYRPFNEMVAKPFEVRHTGSELKQLADYLKSLDGETRVVMEHTGRYYEQIAQYLHDEGIYVSAVNPKIIKDYGTGNTLRHVKTDKADAKKIAKFGIDRWAELRQYASMDTIRYQLKTLNRQCGLYTKTKTMMKNNLIALSAPMRFCSFSANRKCRKMAGKGVQPLNNYTCRFRPSSLKQADKSGLDGLQTGK